MLKIPQIPEPIKTALVEIIQKEYSFQYYYIVANGSIIKKTDNLNDFDFLELHWQGVEFNQDLDIGDLKDLHLQYAVVNNHQDEYVFKYNKKYPKIMEYLGNHFTS
jgi:hypothetical protein